jgi:hypothetical protein
VFSRLGPEFGAALTAALALGVPDTTGIEFGVIRADTWDPLDVDTSDEDRELDVDGHATSGFSVFDSPADTIT